MGINFFQNAQIWMTKSNQKIAGIPGPVPGSVSNLQISHEASDRPSESSKLFLLVAVSNPP